jgi:hypothetical protein
MIKRNRKMQSLFHWDGVQSISWIETDSGDKGKVSIHGMKLGYTENLEDCCRPWKWVKNEKRAE